MFRIRATAMKHHSRGIALVLVLWVTALLSLIAASFTLATRTETRMAADQVDRARADAIAEAGVRLGLMELLRMQGQGGGPRLDGSVFRESFAGYPVDISIMTESAKLDLNRAPPELIQSLFTESLGDPVEAEALSQAVLDWRDEDSDRQPRGAEDADYKGAGLSYGARDGPFLSVSELSQVLGMTEDILQRLHGLVTVDSGLAQVDPFFAPRPVLSAVPGIDAGQLDRFMEERKAGVAGNEAVMGLVTGGGNRYLARTDPRVFTIRAAVHISEGAFAQHEAVVRLTGNREHPYAIIRWSAIAGPAATAEKNGTGSG
jgi:general secretion pathway protein K